MPEKTNQPKKLRITYVKSAIGYSERHKATIRTLGLRKLNQSVIYEDTPDVRGKLILVNHLVKIEEVQVEQ